jgi:hypothetical protein
MVLYTAEDTGEKTSHLEGIDFTPSVFTGLKGETHLQNESDYHS